MMTNFHYPTLNCKKLSSGSSTHTHTLTGYIAIYQGIIQKKYGHIAFFTMQKINFGRHIALSKPAMYFITNAVQSQLSFPCIAMTPDQI